MTTRDETRALVLRMQECFNTRRFDEAAELHDPGFLNHALGATGFAAGREAWRTVVARFPEMRVTAEDILVDGDRVAVRSSVEGIAPTPPMLIEIFRVRDGRFAEMWGLTEGPDPRD
ncbi:ester cyclase [Actinomadura nitritigenes]|uniref:ester cyclase n=1 Tax=Actinomadura nitritigenes TaxID=134602 RepID=UPI003D8A0C2C